MSRLLIGALRAWWALKANEAEGACSDSATVATRLRTVRAAWAAAADADAVYRATRATWEAETGRDATTGQSAHGAETEAGHAAL